MRHRNPLRAPPRYEIGGKQADFFFPRNKVRILSAKAWLLAAQ